MALPSPRSARFRCGACGACALLLSLACSLSWGGSRCSLALSLALALRVARIARRAARRVAAVVVEVGVRRTARPSVPRPHRPHHHRRCAAADADAEHSIGWAANRERQQQACLRRRQFSQARAAAPCAASTAAPWPRRAARVLHARARARVAELRARAEEVEDCSGGRGRDDVAQLRAAHEQRDVLSRADRAQCVAQLVVVVAAAPWALGEGFGAAPPAPIPACAAAAMRRTAPLALWGSAGRSTTRRGAAGAARTKAAPRRTPRCRLGRGRRPRRTRPRRAPPCRTARTSPKR